jgi:hypothetical protein
MGSVLSSSSQEEGVGSGLFESLEVSLDSEYTQITHDQHDLFISHCVRTKERKTYQDHRVVLQHSTPLKQSIKLDLHPIFDRSVNVSLVDR